jgi:hypothetical protein
MSKKERKGKKYITSVAEFPMLAVAIGRICIVGTDIDVKRLRINARKMPAIIRMRRHGFGGIIVEYVEYVE